MYHAPTKDMRFLLFDVLETGFESRDLDPETVTTILEEAAKLARDVIAPLNRPGDLQGCTLKDGVVTSPDGFAEAYAQYRDSGWNSVPFQENSGGQNLPWSLTFAIQEMWQSANMAFGLCPMLNQSAVEALEIHGSESQKATYLSKMVSGQWTGTMNLTEPQAGSDLSQLKTTAIRQEDGSYKITGQKIYITYGEHDLAENIIHMVLARTPEAPGGVKGISLFLVPKFLPGDNGEPDERNDLICTGIEHKMGIHASPTCTMQFGDQGGATGWLVGEEFEGLKLMFTMMNNARLAVGLQGVAISERAFQAGRSYAAERIQGRPVTGGAKKIPIEKHPDVKRMLDESQARILAGRALAYDAAANMDKARAGDKKAAAYVDLLTPVVKAWCTDNALEITSEVIQIYGGMGFIEESGVAQYYRDARILPIYEGTNGIQANDLVFRKILKDQGKVMQEYLNSARDFISSHSAALGGLTIDIEHALERLEQSASKLHELEKNNALEDIAGVAKTFLTLFGITAGAVMMARVRGALDRSEMAAQDKEFSSQMNYITAFYIRQICPESQGLAARISNKAADAL